MTVMATADRQIRADAYRTLSELYLRGVTDELFPVLMDVPDLAELVVQEPDPDERAAVHHRLFELEVLPYASVFLDVDANLGGDVSASVERVRSSAGLSPAQSEPADHLGRELELLAALTGRGSIDAAASFFDHHLLWWLPGFLAALDRHGDAFWRTVGRITMDLVVEHYVELQQGSADDPALFTTPWNLEGSVSSPLDDPRASLRDVAAFLMVPIRSGLYLSEADARRLGRAAELPGGFGSRVRVLETVLHSAVAYDALPEVTTGLARYASGVKEMFDDLAVGRRVPAAFAEPWLSRLEGTIQMLDALASGQGPES